jgi:hypothetical protein
LVISASSLDFFDLLTGLCRLGLDSNGASVGMLPGVLDANGAEYFLGFVVLAQACVIAPILCGAGTPSSPSLDPRKMRGGRRADRRILPSVHTFSSKVWRLSARHHGVLLPAPGRALPTGRFVSPPAPISRRLLGQSLLRSLGQTLAVRRCLRCLGIVTDDNLKAEAAEYGAAGGKAQVVWPNGVLASTAVGLFVQVVSPWHKQSSGFAYLEYNGNTFTLTPSPRIEHAINHRCPHFSTMDVGDPLFELELTN